MKIDFILYSWAINFFGFYVRYLKVILHKQVLAYPLSPPLPLSTPATQAKQVYNLVACEARVPRVIFASCKIKCPIFL